MGFGQGFCSRLSSAWVTAASVRPTTSRTLSGAGGSLRSGPVAQAVRHHGHRREYHGSTAAVRRGGGGDRRGRGFGSPRQRSGAARSVFEKAGQPLGWSAGAIPHGRPRQSPAGPERTRRRRGSALTAVVDRALPGRRGPPGAPRGGARGPGDGRSDAGSEPAQRRRSLCAGFEGAQPLASLHVAHGVSWLMTPIGVMSQRSRAPISRPSGSSPPSGSSSSISGICSCSPFRSTSFPARFVRR